MIFEINLILLIKQFVPHDQVKSIFHIMQDVKYVQS